MELLGSTVFKRKSRTKQIKLKDGSLKDVKLAGGYFFRIRYINDDGLTKTVDRGPFDLKREAERGLDAEKKAIEDTSGNIQAGRKKTFNDLADICEVELYGDRKSNSIGYIIANLRAFFGPRRLSKINRAMLAAYVQKRTSETVRNVKQEDLKRTVKRSTVDKELRIMRSMIYHAIDEGWMTGNPFKASKKLKPLIMTAVGTRNRVLARDEEIRLLECCEPVAKRPVNYTKKISDTVIEAVKSTGNEYLKAIVLLGLDSGMRKGEILQLQWSDILLDEGVILLPAAYTKTKHARVVPLSARTVAELQRLYRLDTDDQGKPFPLTVIDKVFNTAVRLAGIEDLTFHDLRRTFTSRQIAAGTNLAMIAKATGHRDMKILMEHYAKLGIAEMRQLARTVDEENSRNSV